MTCEIAVAGRVTGVAPVWDIASGTLLWVEPGAAAVHRFTLGSESDPDAGRDDSLGLPQPVATAHPRRGGGLVLTLRDGVALVDPDNTRRWLVYWARPGVAGAAATVDQTGRLWAATTGDGTLLRVEPDGALTVVCQEMDISGIAFSPDAETIYLASRTAEQITAADFDPASGRIGPRRPVCPVPGGAGALCVDTEGRLWVVPDNGTAVHRYHPDGTLAQQLPVDTPPTGCTFGGPGLSDLYLTTASSHANDIVPLLILPTAGTGLPTPVFAG